VWLTGIINQTWYTKYTVGGRKPFNSKTKTMFEDTHTETFIINRKNYKDFIRYFNILKSWSKGYIDDIEKIYGKNLVI
jgi:hypothetical protein